MNHISIGILRGSAHLWDPKMFTLIKIVGIKVKVAIQHVNRQCNLKQILLLSMYQQLDVAKSLGRLYILISIIVAQVPLAFQRRELYHPK